MNFLDNLIINIFGGKGGDGCISFSKFNKNKFRIPNGGNGGNGGNVYIIASKTINCLNYLNSKKKIIAKNGYNGKSNYCSGKNGEDLFIKVPIGTKIIDINTNKIIYDLIYDNMCIFLVKGGLKGLGNGVYKQKNINDNFYYKGKLGKNLSIKLKLELFCDIGIFGLTNSGKSSISKVICFKKNKVSIDHKYINYPKINKCYINNYDFLHIIDTPGIILKKINIKNKIKYFNHLNRCKLLLHIIDISIILNNKIDFFSYIKKINIILKNNVSLKDKKIWIIFNKLDLFEKYNEINNKIKDILKKFNINTNYYIISTINKNKYLKIFKYKIYDFFNQYNLKN